MPASWKNQLGRLIQISYWIILNQLKYAASSLTDDYNSALSPLFEQYLIVTGVGVSKILDSSQKQLIKRIDTQRRLLLIIAL